MKLKKKIIALVVCGLLAATSVVLMAEKSEADWWPEFGHKMHFPQLPDEDGCDVWASDNMVLADDWLCTGSGYVRDIHFWGSWYLDDIGVINYFEITIWSNNPGIPGEIPSHPDSLLWCQQVTDFDVLEMEPSRQAFYWPQEGGFDPDNHARWFQYNMYFDEAEAFWQIEGTILDRLHR